MLKTTKRYVITTNALNSKGFRILSEGIDWTDYNNNPILLYMHYRPTGADKNEIRAIGNVRDIQTDSNGVVTGQLYFNDKYDFAVSIFEGYENGTYNMLSLCAQPLESSDKPEHILAGQTLPTVSKCKAKEISCIDIGSNGEAIGVELCDTAGNIIKLSDALKVNLQTNTKALPEPPFKSPKISATYLVKKAFDDGKIIKDKIDYFTELAAIYPNEIMALFDKMPKKDIMLLEMESKSWADLDQSGELETLKMKSPAVFREKFFKKFGKYPN